MPLNTMQGLTPTITVKVPTSIDLTEAANIYVSFKQGNRLVLKLSENLDVSAHQVAVYLTQEQTLMFKAGPAEIQVNWTYSSGQRGATKRKEIYVDANHLLEVLP